tara:strand:- start:78 stop:2654 length:2577 start_codon:yes stop_codon:yes gene_type:complete
MSISPKPNVTFTMNGKEVQAKVGVPILQAAQQQGFEITNLCFNRKLKPFAACRTCMVEVKDKNGEKKLVYSCTQPVEEGISVQINTEETNRYNNACLELLLVEHPLDCPICDKSGVCPLQDNTEAMGIFNGRFEIKRRNEPSIKSNPLIELYLNRCIMCGMCVRVCDETQGVQALDYHQRGYGVGIGTANDEPLDCEFCGQCITVCPTGALNDLSSQARGLAALFSTTETTCNYCSWGCTLGLETKKGELIRITADETPGVGINDGNLCAKGRFGHGFVQNENRLKTPLINVGGNFQEISWSEALKTIAERFQAQVNRSGANTVAGIGSEKMTNEEAYLFQKLFREVLGSNQVTNLQNIRSSHVNHFMLKCFENGIYSKPVTEMENSDVILIFNSDLPSEYPVGGNSARKGAIFNGTELIIANPRNVVFKNEAPVQARLPFKLGTDAAVINRISKIIIEKKLVDLGKIKNAVPNFEELVNSLDRCTAENSQELTGLSDEILTHAAERFARPADRFVIVGNDVLEGGQGEAVLNALLNLSIIVHGGGHGSVSIFPPREHCNSQGCNDMGVTPEFLPGYQPANNKDNPAENLFESCKDGKIKALYIAGEDPMHTYYKGSLSREALQTVPFLVVQDLVMTETAKMADIVLPICSFAEKEGTFTNMTRHVQKVSPAVLPEGSSMTEFDILVELAEALGKPFASDSVQKVQNEICDKIPFYKGIIESSEYKQWSPGNSFETKPGFSLSGNLPALREGKFPFKLLANNHMFHIGNYTQYAKALTDVSGECVAQINRTDARKLNIESGDMIYIESDSGKLELKAEINGVTAQGMVYVPKNWVNVPVNQLRNGEEGYVSVKVSKAS